MEIELDPGEILDQGHGHPPRGLSLADVAATGVIVYYMNQC